VALRTTDPKLIDRAAKHFLDLAAHPCVELVRAEVGKPDAEALFNEALGPLDSVNAWASLVEKHASPQKVSLNPIAFPGKRATVERVARGVVGIIAPWNFPVSGLYRSVFPALLTGNAVVLKPSEKSPRSSAWLVEVLAAHLPEGLVAAVQGDGRVGQQLLNEVDACVFTGSVAAGRAVRVRCAERGIPCSAEMGGNDAAIVLADCDLPRTVAGVTAWALNNAGQACGGIEVAYVDRAIADTFVPRLARAIADQGHDVELLSLGAPDERRTLDVPHRVLPQAMAGVRFLDKLGLSPLMRSTLRDRAAGTDILHTNGLWMMPNVYPARLARIGGPAMVLSPRGMLNPAALRYSAGVKHLFWLALQGPAARRTAMFHATSEQEFEEIRTFGLRQPVAVVPNGIELPPEPSPWKESRLVLSLGRIHPKKGLDRLLGAWARVEREAIGWRLEIVGPSENGHAEELQALATQLGLQRATVRGPIFGEKKAKLYAEAELFVLPTRGENFAMTVAESLASGTPVISSKGAPWAGLEVHRCGWWVDHGPEPLAAALLTAIALPSEERAQMGRHGADWMARDFAWEGIGQSMSAAYLWLRDGGEPPSCMRL
jgi:glycosyltransferase involved in cell wall biosynthesis